MVFDAKSTLHNTGKNGSLSVRSISRIRNLSGRKRRARRMAFRRVVQGFHPFFCTALVFHFVVKPLRLKIDEGIPKVPQCIGIPIDRSCLFDRRPLIGLLPVTSTIPYFRGKSGPPRFTEGLP